MKVQSELDIQRETTADFIDQLPTSIVLTRSTRTRTGTGGYTEVESSLPAQEFRIIGSSSLLEPERRAEVGEVAGYRVQMVGHWDADVQDGDSFVLNNHRYRVEFVYPERSHRTVVDTVYRGVVPSG